ncbi:hypothetical protein JFT91_03215 [Pseudomonas sp. TH08]|nr:hypothetical protein [Pseudomonas sp. TH08]MBK5531616.1 hypothetical protein [Pseudomonas sp. TH08]
MFFNSGTELKYKSRSPLTSEEVLEAIHEEVSNDEKKNRGGAIDRTLKTYVGDILEVLEEFRREERDKKEDAESSVWHALLLLAIIAIVLLVNGTHGNPDFDWLDENSFAFKIWGTALAMLYLGVQIERLSVFRSLWQYGFTKLIVSVSISGLVVFSTAKAASAINNVFAVDASVFSFTLTFVSALIVFKYLSSFVIVLGLVAGIHTLNFIGWVRSKSWSDWYDSVPINSFFLIVFSIVVMGFCWGWSHRYLDDEYMPEKVYKLARVLDFNDKHDCSNVTSDMPVVFMGASKDIVLVDPNNTQVVSVQSFLEDGVEVPSSFVRKKCDL